MTSLGDVGLLRRFFEKRKLRKQLEMVGARDRRNSDYSPAQMCIGILYALMLGIFRPSHMKDIIFVGYGAMLVEAFVAIMALIAACVLVPSDYFAINATAEAYKTLGMSLERSGRCSA